MTRSREDGVFGNQRPNSGNNEFNALTFLVKQILARVNVATLVKVVEVHTTGRTAAVGTVDVTPLVSIEDAYGEPIPHTTIYGLPYMRTQGGANAFICDPKAGDIGLCVFCDRDTSNVKDSGEAELPGSKRRFDMADGFFVGGWNLSVTPSHYIVVDDAGISIESGSAQTDMHASKLVINAPVEINGDITHTGRLHSTGAATFDSSVTADGEVTAGAAKVKLSNHRHIGVTVGTGVTGGPI